MRYQFLCPTHSQWLSDNPTSAVNCYHTTLDTGHHFRDIGDINNAIRYFGCASETADILLSVSTKEARLQAIKRLVSSSMNLIDCLKHSKHDGLEENIIQQLVAKLNSELTLPLLDKGQKQQIFVLLENLPAPTLKVAS